MPQIRITKDEYEYLVSALSVAEEDSSVKVDHYREAAECTEREIEKEGRLSLARAWSDRQDKYRKLGQRLRSMQLGDSLKIG